MFNYSIHFFKLIAAIFVVILHIGAPNFISSVIVRLAVPFFFVSAGYFYYSKINNWNLTKKYLIKIFNIYLVTTIIYYPDIHKQLINNTNNYFKYFVIFSRNFIFTGTYYHLWFLPALITGVLLLYIVNRIKLQNKYLYVLSICLYIFGMLGDAYSFLNNKELLFQYNRVFGFTRNGLFCGFSLIFLGSLIKKNEEKLKKRFNIINFSLSFSLFFFEIYILNKYFLGPRNILLFSPLVIFNLYLFLINDPLKKFLCNYLSKIDYSLIIYLVHPFVINIFPYKNPNLKLSIIPFLSFLIAFIYFKLKDMIGGNIKKLESTE